VMLTGEGPVGFLPCNLCRVRPLSSWANACHFLMGHEPGGGLAWCILEIVDDGSDISWRWSWLVMLVRDRSRGMLWRQ